MKIKGVRFYARLLIRLGLTGSGFWAKFLEKTGLYNTVREFIPERILRRIPKEEHLLLTNADIDWAETKAYSFGEQPIIYVNLVGREPLGRVNLGKEYEEVRNQVKYRLESLTDEGKSLRVRVWKREELYDGKHFGEMPDLVLIIENGSYHISTSIGHEALFYEPGRWSGAHKLDGVFMAVGNQVKRNCKVNASIIDLMPTILHIFDLPIPNDVDGRVLKEIFVSESTLAKRETKYGRFREERKEYVWKSDEEEEVRQRLRDLGYID